MSNAPSRRLHDDLDGNISPREMNKECQIPKNDSPSGHVGPESKMELTDLIENTNETKVENREVESDPKEFQQTARSDKHDDRVDDDAKHMQHERESYSEVKEKDDAKKETWNGSDKEAPQNDMETVYVPGKVVEEENFSREPKKQDYDPKNVGRESIDNKKKREGDVEPERPDKRIRCREIESDDGSAPVAVKTDLSCVVYKVGECLQGVTELWKEYELQSDKASGSSQNGPTLEIRIPAEHVTATNHQVRSGQLWGTDIYTVDSDLVAVLMHTGYCRTTASAAPSPAQEYRATVRVLPPQECYISTLRNDVRSRAWGAAVGCSYQVERCCIVKKRGGIVDLEPCLTHSSKKEPTFAPVDVECTMTTRAAASKALRRQIFLREITVQFNFCMEPWLKYSINAVADNGLKKSVFTSARLKQGEVLYVETHFCRYELCFTGQKPTKASTHRLANAGDTESIMVDTFRWSRCKKPLPRETMLSVGIPLSLECVEVLAENLEWDDIDWSQSGVWVAGKEYHLARAHFLAPN